MDILKLHTHLFQNPLYLLCDDESLTEIPLEQIPHNLTYLKIAGTNISSVGENAFQDRSIETLSLANNKIVMLNRYFYKATFVSYSLIFYVSALLLKDYFPPDI